MAAESEPDLVRWRVTVPAADADLTLARLLDSFPDGLEEEPDGAVVHLSGYLVAGAAPRLPAGLDVISEPVAAGWRDGWRGFHRAVRIGRFWVGPPWIEPDPGSDAIVIEPGLAFGTGAHGSTRAAAELLLRLGGNGAIGDVGCGSGVLAIIAARLGYRPVIALDNDPNAVAATVENAERNGVSITASRADALVDRLPATPVLLANLQLELLRPLFERADLPGVVIVSGLLEREAFAPARWVRADEQVCDGWRAVRFER